MSRKLLLDIHIYNFQFSNWQSGIFQDLRILRNSILNKKSVYKAYLLQLLLEALV